ncbi:MAG: PH domain-containing protein [Calditrichaceae bacterium]|nr:PH domain-containing protein [Calditrichaceae bacterium]
MEKSFKPDKKYFVKVLLIQLTVTLFVAFGVSIISLIINAADGEPEAKYVIWFIAMIGLALMWIITTIISYLWIKNLEYEVLPDRVKIYQGILTKTQKNIPFRMITDFALVRTLYDRFLGIGSIRIQTAGQSHQPTGYEGKFGGLVDYEIKHEALRERITALHPAADTVQSVSASSKSDSTVLEQILIELKAIKKNTSQ